MTVVTHCMMCDQIVITQVVCQSKFAGVEAYVWQLSHKYYSLLQTMTRVLRRREASTPYWLEFLNIYYENPPLWNSKTDQIKYLHFKCIILSILSIFSNILLIPKYCHFLLKLISNIEYYFFSVKKIKKKIKKMKYIYIHVYSKVALYWFKSS